MLEESKQGDVIESGSGVEDELCPSDGQVSEGLSEKESKMRRQ